MAHQLHLMIQAGQRDERRGQNREGLGMTIPGMWWRPEPEARDAGTAQAPGNSVATTLFPRDIFDMPVSRSEPGPNDPRPGVCLLSTVHYQRKFPSGIS